MLNKNTILQEAEKLVYDKLHTDASGHDWWHIKRVYNNAMLINQKEKANEFIITMIAYMHDLYDHKFYDGDISLKLEETLKELEIYDKVPKKDIENIIYSCVNLGFSANLNGKKELSKEGKMCKMQID